MSGLPTGRRSLEGTAQRTGSSHAAYRRGRGRVPSKLERSWQSNVTLGCQEYGAVGCWDDVSAICVRRAPRAIIEMSGSVFSLSYQGRRRVGSRTRPHVKASTRSRAVMGRRAFSRNGNRRRSPSSPSPWAALIGVPVVFMDIDGGKMGVVRQRLSRAMCRLSAHDWWAVAYPPARRWQCHRCGAIAEDAPTLELERVRGQASNHGVDQSEGSRPN